MNTFEKVDAHLNTAVPAVTGTTLKGAKLHQVWNVARPVFMLLAATPFIPAKWKAVLTALADGLDALDTTV